MSDNEDDPSSKDQSENQPLETYDSLSLEEDVENSKQQRFSVERDDAAVPDWQKPRPQAAAQKKPRNTPNEFEYDGRTGQVYKIAILNFFLRILTLGIYGFWGKTRLRKYVASSFSLGGDRFEYTGTGMELFKGFLKAMGIYFVLVSMVSLCSLALTLGLGIDFETDVLALVLFSLPVYLLFFWFLNAAVFAAFRYRLSRTRWRGIRGFMRGSALKFGGFGIKQDILTVLTLGILLPRAQIAKHRYIVDSAFFGNIDMRYEDDGQGLVKLHILTAILAIFTLGLSRFWYRAALIRKKFNGIVLDDLRLRSEVTGGALMGHILINIFIIIITLGLGIPYAMQRNMRFFCAYTFVIGDLNTSKVTQAENQKISIGEGLDDVLGIDTGLM